MHAEVLPVSVEYDPGSQPVQLDAPVEVWYWPAAHDGQIATLPSEYEPAGHEAQVEPSW